MYNILIPPVLLLVTKYLASQCTTVRPRYSYGCCPFQDGGPGGTFLLLLLFLMLLLLVLRPVCEGHVFILAMWCGACVIHLTEKERAGCFVLLL